MEVVAPTGVMLVKASLLLPRFLLLATGLTLMSAYLPATSRIVKQLPPYASPGDVVALRCSELECPMIVFPGLFVAWCARDRM